ncbi:MAG TPA: amino acid ABC transporter substrate-binding protein [Trebonia sp.]|nr:amino acid ABC transporter substrate-binding protein [Trebonia sp.]
MSAHLPWFSKNVVAVGAVALSVGVLAACSSSGSSSSTASTGTSPTGSASGSSSSTPIYIGASLSLTGDFSADGTAFQKGYELWVKDVNAAGGIMGRQVKLTVLDDKSDPNQVVTNYQTLINSDHVNLTFGPFSSLLTTPASAVAARNGYAFIEGAGGAPTVFDTASNQADHNTFDVSLPVADSLLPFVNYVASLGSTADKNLTAAYATADDPLNNPQTQLAQSKLQALNVKTVYSKIFPEESTSYKPAADQVAAAKPDIVVLGSSDVPTVQAFMQEFAQDHYTPKMFIATAGPDQGTAFTSAVGAGNATGMMVPNAWYPGFTNAASEKMVSEYTAQYGGTASGVQADVAEAYSVGQVTEDAINATGGIQNSKIISYLHSGVTLQTVQGAVHFDSLGENTSALAFTFQWQDSGTKFVQVLPSNATGSVPIVATKPPWAS